MAPTYSAIDTRSHRYAGASEPAAANVLSGTVAQVVFLGDTLDVGVDVAGVRVTAHVPPSTEVRRGDQTWLELPAEDCTVIHDDHGVTSGRRLDDSADASAQDG